MPTTLIILAVFMLVIVLIFNNLIAKKNQVRNIFATTDALLKKRYDLIPQLVTTVKTYMKHEQHLFEKITETRIKALAPNLSDDLKVNLDNSATKTLNSILLAVENYPNLKASTNFMHLQRTLTELEEQISAARRAYNAAVTDFNNSVQMFPSNIVASIFNYKPKKLFEISPPQRQNVAAGELLDDSFPKKD